MQHTGELTDAVKGYASGQAAKDWCLKYGLPREARFGSRKFGMDQANALASAWCARLQLLYDMFLSANMDEFVYSRADLEVVSPVPAELTDMASGSTVVRERLTQIQGMMPKRDSGSSSSGIAR